MKYLILILFTLFLSCNETQVLPITSLEKSITQDTVYITVVDTLIKTEVIEKIVYKTTDQCPEFIMQELENVQLKNSILKDSLYEVFFTLNAVIPYLPDNIKVMLVGEKKQITK